MKAYSDILRTIIDYGEERGDRTGTGTKSIFSSTFVHDLSKGFPLLTGKEMNLHLIVAELVWFLKGNTNVDVLRELTWGLGSKKKTIWDANYDNQGVALGYSKGELGPIYGKQWRGFGSYYKTEHGNLKPSGVIVDQLQDIITEAKRNPESRRLLVSAWNPLELDKMALPPCHWAFELYISNGKLNLKWHQRSVDVFLGLPFNIASYALLAHILASILGLEPGLLIGDLSNVHIYSNHIDQVMEYLSRDTRELPSLVMPKLNDLDEITSYKFDLKSIFVEGYNPHPSIKAPMAV